MEDAKAKRETARAAEAEAVWKAAWEELGHRLPEQRPFVVASLPADAAPLVEVRVETKGRGLILWRLRAEARAVTLCTQRDGPHWWRITITRPSGDPESRGITIVATREGNVEGHTGPADATKRSFPLREDGALVVDWGQLVPDR